MENFTIYNPTKLHFGSNVTGKLGKTISAYGNKILLIYGKNSIKENGIYNQIITQLKSVNADIFEYSGIKSNPVIEDVDAASRLGRNNNVDLVLAVGGGSVIDSAKVISVGIPVSHSAWDFFSGLKKPHKSVPLIAVLTLAATGTEMNPYAVIQNYKTKQKLGWGNLLCFPKHSFLDPQFTLSVPKNYTAYGIADIVAHCLEAYFGKGEAQLSDSIVISIINEAFKDGPSLLNDLKNYLLREKIMYAATLALNGITMAGRTGGDWGVHDIGHVLSLLYDTPHGASLTIAYPAWLKIMKDRIPERISDLGYKLFGVRTPEETIICFEDFFQQLGCPVRLEEADIAKEKKQQIYDTLLLNRVNGMNHKLDEEDIKVIVELMYE